MNKKFIMLIMLSVIVLGGCLQKENDKEVEKENNKYLEDVYSENFVFDELVNENSVEIKDDNKENEDSDNIDSNKRALSTNDMNSIFDFMKSNDLLFSDFDIESDFDENNVLNGFEIGMNYYKWLRFFRSYTNYYFVKENNLEIFIDKMYGGNFNNGVLEFRIIGRLKYWTYIATKGRIKVVDSTAKGFLRINLNERMDKVKIDFYKLEIGGIPNNFFYSLNDRLSEEVVKLISNELTGSDLSLTGLMREFFKAQIKKMIKNELSDVNFDNFGINEYITFEKFFMRDGKIWMKFNTTQEIREQQSLFYQKANNFIKYGIFLEIEKMLSDENIAGINDLLNEFYIKNGVERKIYNIYYENLRYINLAKENAKKYLNERPELNIILEKIEEIEKFNNKLYRYKNYYLSESIIKKAFYKYSDAIYKIEIIGTKSNGGGLKKLAWYRNNGDSIEKYKDIYSNNFYSLTDNTTYFYGKMFTKGSKMFLKNSESSSLCNKEIIFYNYNYQVISKIEINDYSQNIVSNSTGVPTDNYYEFFYNGDEVVLNKK